MFDKIIVRTGHEHMQSARYASYAEWYSRGPLSSYVRASGTAGDAITIIEATQPAGDMSDPPVNDLILMRSVSFGIPFAFDLGAGRFSGIERHGDFHLAPPNTRSDIQVHAPHSVQLFSLCAKTCLELFQGERVRGLDFGLLHRQLFRSELLNALCERLARATRSPEASSRLFAESAAMAMLAELTLLAGHEAERRQRIDIRDWRIRRTIDQLDSRLGDDVSLAELAAGVDLSPSHYTSLFRAATGLPPHAWLVRRRIERACELLSDPRMSITEIAHTLGFSSSQHLATTFRNQTGATPSEWRRERIS